MKILNRNLSKLTTLSVFIRFWCFYHFGIRIQNKSHWGWIKQWPLDSKFCKCHEYLREYSRMHFLRVSCWCCDSPDLPTFAKPCCADSPDSTTFAGCVMRTRRTCRHSPSRVARTRQTRERQVWQLLCKFSKSGKSGKSGEFGQCRLDRFMYIKYVICAKNDLSYHARLCRAVLRGLARLADIRRAVLRGLARLAI